MADDDKKPHSIFGSAGMAAAGMTRRNRGGTKASPAPGDEETPVVPDPAPEAAPEADTESPVAAVEESGASSDEHATHIEFATDWIEPDPEPPVRPTPPPPPAPRYLRAAVIGHTGKGNYGHGLDQLFLRLDGVRLSAIADADPEGLDAAQIRTGAEKAYADFREMLASEELDLVAVGPRETGERYEMVKAALEAGAHVCCERPIARTLREADELVALAAEKNLKLAVLHPMRLDPHVARFHSERAEIIGDLLEMRVFGMMDHRAGGEDLLVLGPHLFDLVRLFGGEAEFCTASITKNGEAVIADDAHFSEKEDLGPVLGDSIHAEIVMDSGVQVSYVTDQRLHFLHGPWGIEFIGTRGKARLFASQPPTLSVLVDDDPASPDRASRWTRWPAETEPYHEPVDRLTGNDAANRIVVADWLASIAEDREPVCSGLNAMKALEIVHGIWQAGLTKRRAYFPLANRLHPLIEEPE
jgi:predicted dehydrogenase